MGLAAERGERGRGGVLSSPGEDGVLCKGDIKDWGQRRWRNDYDGAPRTFRQASRFAQGSLYAVGSLMMAALKGGGNREMSVDHLGGSEESRVGTGSP